LIPLVTGLGNAISLILAGSFLIEKVFNIDGMGYLGYTAILQRDYPVPSASSSSTVCCCSSATSCPT
jgi:ABC-type dipeptide/oligopeptide/nickel transport system permease component